MPRRSPKSLRASGPGERRPPDGVSPPSEGDTSAPLGGRRTQHTRNGEFLVRVVPGSAARKPYRCPGCQQLIPSGTAHVVVWPAEDPSWLQTAVESRRHWHRSCWHRRATRGGPGTTG